MQRARKKLRSVRDLEIPFVALSLRDLTRLARSTPSVLDEYITMTVRMEGRLERQLGEEKTLSQKTTGNSCF